MGLSYFLKGCGWVESTHAPFTEPQQQRLISRRVSCPFSVRPAHKGRLLCTPAGTSLAFEQHNHPFHCFQLPCSPPHPRKGLGAEPGALGARGWGALGREICHSGYLKQLLGSFRISSSPSYQELQH